MRSAHRVQVVTVAVLICAMPGVSAMAHADNDIALVELVADVAQRLALTQSVAAAKYSRGMPVGDPSREQQVLDGVAATASQNGIAVGPVTMMFRDQIDAAVTLEHLRIADWTTHPDRVPNPIPELPDLRAQIDTIDQRIVAEVAQQQDRLRAPTCRTDLEDARVRVSTQLGFDEPGRTALAQATHHLCLPAD